MNCTIEETVGVLVEGCKAKNGTMAELSIGYLKTLIKHIDKAFFMEPTETRKALFKQLLVEVDGKRMKMKKAAEETFREIKEVIGAEKVGVIITESLEDEE